jgi:hypothetical protein
VKRMQRKISSEKFKNTTGMLLFILLLRIETTIIYFTYIIFLHFILYYLLQDKEQGLVLGELCVCSP